MWDALRLDVRHSFRSLRRVPAFSLIVIGLAVGVVSAWQSVTVHVDEALRDEYPCQGPSARLEITQERRST